MPESNDMKSAGYQQTIWDLSELLPSEDEALISARLNEIEDAVKAFESRRTDLERGINRDELPGILREYDLLLERMHTLSAYGSLRFSEDTQSPSAITLRNRFQHALTGLSNRILFFSLWWKELDDEVAEALLPREEEHPDYRHYLRDLRRFTPFTLDERSEQIINLKDTNGISALLTVYSMLANRLEFTIRVDGQEKVCTRDGLMKYVRSPRPEVREAAYRELYRVYAGEKQILAQIYVNRVRDWHSENLEIRGFSRPITVRNLANDIPDEAVEILLDTSRRNAGIFRRYFTLKAGWLGTERLRRYDLYAPIAKTEHEISFPDAVDTVLETFRDFNPHFAELAERVFARNHIDSEIRRGKRGGAFCATVLPSQTPWVLTNFAGEVRDVATLAHELGHAVHSMLADGHPVLTQHPVLPLAETASVFGEMLVTDRLLSRENDPLLRRELLVSAMDDVYATVIRQTYFVLFEIEAHQAILDGSSPEDLNDLYLENLREQFDDSLELSDDFALEWITIPHIYSTPFYCYSYSFGQLLVLALYRRYLEEGEAFKEGYLRLLTHGGSARPRDILAEAGIDMIDPAFWQGGFDVVEGMLNDLEAIKVDDSP